MATDVTEIKTINLDVNHPSFELVSFTTANSGDYYDCKKLRHVDAAFACQYTTDGVDLQVSWEKQSNGMMRVTITPEAGAVFTGSLVIIGRL